MKSLLLSYLLCLQQVSKGESEVEEAVSDGVVETVIAARTVYCRRVLGLRGGQTAILANGRVSHAVYVYWCMQNSIPLDSEPLFFYQIPTVNGAMIVLLVVLFFFKANFTMFRQRSARNFTQ